MQVAIRAHVEHSQSQAALEYREEDHETRFSWTIVPFFAGVQRDTRHWKQGP